MECNKDEALRAKAMAETKMQNNDFEAARKIAVKAQTLFPELENINQLLMVCNVHCAAQSRIMGSEKDLYGILQLEKFADEATIKKQYRKLALVLHPDKNKLPGAEAAFKLIGEANMVLLDPGKRAIYDSKCRVSVRTVQSKPPPHQVNRNPPARKHSASNNMSNGFASQFSSVNLNQTTSSNPSVSQEAFWTSCPFCNTKYQYQKKFVNSPLRCQRCSKPFIAYDLGAQGVPSGFNPGQGAQGVPPRSNGNQPPQKDIPHAGSFRTGATNTAAYPASHVGPRGKANSRTVKSESGTTVVSTKDACGKVKTDELKVDAGKPRESREQRNKGKKRGRKQVVESSESCDSSSSDDTDEVVIDENSGVNGLQNARRSSRNRQNISYNENKSDDDDFVSPPKRSRLSKASIDDEVKREANGKDEYKSSSTSFPTSSANMKQGESFHPEGIPQMGKNQETADMMGTGADKIEIEDDSESDGDLDNDPKTASYELTEPEFYDFDKDKEESCFSVDQIWALYDTIDGMPRFYAQIKKVFKPGFKVRITWLEADPENQTEDDWVNKELPYGCGRFKRGNSDDMSDHLTFSHQVQCGKGRSRVTLMIYPRKGEVWALYNDWDIKWSSDSKDHTKFKYEIVEIVSDFVEGAGIRVSYLDKVEGFRCLFQRSNQSEMDSLVIPPNELLRFSHRVPSCKMSGNEKEGVPGGSYELDSASLPVDPNDICYPGKVKEESQTMDA